MEILEGNELVNNITFLSGKVNLLNDEFQSILKELPFSQYQPIIKLPSDENIIKSSIVLSEKKKISKRYSGVVHLYWSSEKCRKFISIFHLVPVMEYIDRMESLLNFQRDYFTFPRQYIAPRDHMYHFETTLMGLCLEKFSFNWNNQLDYVLESCQIYEIEYNDASHYKFKYPILNPELLQNLIVKRNSYVDDIHILDLISMNCKILCRFIPICIINKVNFLVKFHQPYLNVSFQYKAPDIQFYYMRDVNFISNNESGTLLSAELVKWIPNFNSLDTSIYNANKPFETMVRKLSNDSCQSDCSTEINLKLLFKEEEEEKEICPFDILIDKIVDEISDIMYLVFIGFVLNDYITEVSITTSIGLSSDSSKDDRIMNRLGFSDSSSKMNVSKSMSKSQNTGSGDNSKIISIGSRSRRSVGDLSRFSKVEFKSPKLFSEPKVKYLRGFSQFSSRSIDKVKRDTQSEKTRRHLYSSRFKSKDLKSIKVSRKTPSICSSNKKSNTNQFFLDVQLYD